MPDPKRSNVTLDKGVKCLCLKSLIEVFTWSQKEAVTEIREANAGQKLNVSDALVSILFKTHNMLRQKQNSNLARHMQTKSSGTDFPINYKGKSYTINKVSAKGMWKTVLEVNGLRYDVEKD